MRCGVGVPVLDGVPALPHHNNAQKISYINIVCVLLINYRLPSRTGISVLRYKHSGIVFHLKFTVQLNRCTRSQGQARLEIIFIRTDYAPVSLYKRSNESLLNLNVKPNNCIDGDVRCEAGWANAPRPPFLSLRLSLQPLQESQQNFQRKCVICLANTHCFSPATTVLKKIFFSCLTYPECGGNTWRVVQRTAVALNVQRFRCAVRNLQEPFVPSPSTQHFLPLARRHVWRPRCNHAALRARLTPHLQLTNPFPDLFFNSGIIFTIRF